MIDSADITSYRQSKAYQMISEFEGQLRLANDKFADLNEEDVSISQEDENFAQESLYSIRFTPTNPIRKAGWVKLVYPKTISIADEAQFVATCQAETSISL